MKYGQNNYVFVNTQFVRFCTSSKKGPILKRGPLLTYFTKPCIENVHIHRYLEEHSNIYYMCQY